MIAGRRFIYICGSKLIMKNKKNLILTIILSLVAVIILIGAIIILRALLSILIHYEVKSEKEHNKNIVDVEF